jgi:hypothetical protein
MEYWMIEASKTIEADTPSTLSMEGRVGEDFFSSPDLLSI